jgi:hypothetical protein
VSAGSHDIPEGTGKKKRMHARVQTQNTRDTDTQTKILYGEQENLASVENEWAEKHITRRF